MFNNTIFYENSQLKIIAVNYISDLNLQKLNIFHMYYKTISNFKRFIILINFKRENFIN